MFSDEHLDRLKAFGNSYIRAKFPKPSLIMDVKRVLISRYPPFFVHRKANSIIINIIFLLWHTFLYLWILKLFIIF